MQNILKERRGAPVGAMWGEINGVRLTKIDEQQQYASDTIAQVLENQDRGRHVARVAHLYFARHPVLPQADLEVHLLTLIRKILGPSPMIGSDWGWLGTMSFPDLPRSIRDELRRDLDSTFDEDKWSAEHLKAFRVFQLLTPTEPENLFKVVYCRPNGPFQYLFPIVDLPARTEEVLNIWRLGRMDVYVPKLYIEICGDPPKIVEGFLQLDLADWFTLRFLNWFTGYSVRTQASSADTTGGQQVGSSSSSKKKRVQFALVSLNDMKAGNPPFELLHNYLEVFIPHAKSDLQTEPELVSLRAKAIFRWAIEDLWLNRIKVAPNDPSTALASLRLLQSMFILITHVANDEGLCTEDGSGRGDMQLSKSFLAFRAAFYKFFMYTLGEASFMFASSDTSLQGEASFDMIVDLWSVYLSPWKAAMRVKGHEGPIERLLHLRGPANAEKSGDQNAGVQPQWLWFIIHNYCGYLHFFHKTLERLDQESNPSWEALEALARNFHPDAHGPLSPSVLGALLACDQVWTGSETQEIPEPVRQPVEARKAFQFVMEHKAAVKASIRAQYEELGFTSDNYPVRSFLASVVVQIKGFVRELNHKRKSHQSVGLSGLSLSHNPHQGKDVDQICRAFGIPPDQESERIVPSGGFSSSGSESRWMLGVPRWLGTAEKNVRARYRVLTEEGRKRVQNGEGNSELAMQYVGDYSRRPVEAFEVPVLVRFAAMINEAVEQLAGVQIDMRPFADARNILWIVIAFNLIAFFKGYARLSSTWIFAVYCMGAGTLRGPSEKLWSLIFVALALYQLW